MRPALFLAAVLAAAALSPAAGAQPLDPKSVSDIRCVIVAGTLSQSDDPQLKSLGITSMFYFLGRLEGRSDTGNLATRLASQGHNMSADDVKAQAKICGDMVTAAGQSLQDLGDMLQKQSGASPAPAPPQ